MNRRSFLLGSTAVTALALGASRLASAEPEWLPSDWIRYHLKDPTDERYWVAGRGSYGTYKGLRKALPDYHVILLERI